MSKLVKPTNPAKPANHFNPTGDKLKGRAVCETHDCIPKESLADTVKFKSWVSVYRVFMSIADTVLELPEGTSHDYAHFLINSMVNALYAQHTGEDAWDIAYAKWIEPSDDDESSPILK